MQQRLFPPIGPVIAISEDEYSWLMRERLRAQRELLDQLGVVTARELPGLDEVRSSLLVHERTAEGHLRASIVIRVAGHTGTYRRRLRCVLGHHTPAERTVRLRQTP